jgi:hypothetical protein
MKEQSAGKSEEKPYAISDLILDATSGGDPLKLREVASKLGYADIQEAMEDLEQAWMFGDCTEEVKRNLARALGVPQEVVDKAISETERAQAEDGAANDTEAERRAAKILRGEKLELPPKKPYPIAQLILSVIGNNPEKRREVESKLGYRHEKDARDNLSILMRDGVCVKRVGARLAGALGVAPEIVEQAMRDTDIQRLDECQEEELNREAEARAAFRPHIKPVTYRPPLGQITITAVTVGSAVNPIPLPENIASLSQAEQRNIVRWAITEHQKAWADRVAKSGLRRILGYEYARTYDDRVFLSPDGEPAERPAEGAVGSFYVRVGHKVVDANVARRVFLGGEKEKE